MTGPPEGDSAGREFSDVDLSGAQFRRVGLRNSTFRLTDLSGALMRGVYLVEADLDGEIEGLRVCGVEVAPLIEAELDRRHPERAALRATDPAGLRAGWAALEAMWANTLERVEAMPVGTRDASVEGEWSVVETLRHLVLATDCWLGTAIQRRKNAFHPIGLLFSEFAGREAEYGLDAAATPTYRDVLEARGDRMAMVRRYLDEVTPDELTEVRADPWGSPWEPTVLDCVRVIFNEEWHHHRYITRDLDTLAARDS